MTERDALHAAVCAHPDDDTPRLVFADWLQEHDEEERAEFIRVQIEAARLPAGKKRTAKEARANELLAVYEKAWAKPIKRFVAQPLRGAVYAFRRGFIDTVAVRPNQFLEDIDDLFELLPLRGLHFVDSDGIDWVAGCERMLRITELNLSGCVLSSGASDVPKVLRSKYLANLVSLNASGFDDNGHLDNRGLAAIANSKHFQKLERLDVGDNWMFVGAPPRTANVTRELLWRLGANMPALRELCLTAMELNCATVGGLVIRPWVAQLRKLDLCANEIGEAGCHALCASKQLAHLEELDLRENLIELPAATKRELKARFGKRVRL
jgi:uncharacterized protein (TIGR02996 family)